ncbi:hypothetical protein CSV72_13665 [Sporosarcina sp. P20a]|uniref:GNAT family N-acetyltransferase n=1 Tax=Sporosarcina sp. P20a TaxID=2048256 RepID=UPI000C168A52|nr:GNAT family N-acetyltransferase [Sporosarcina sp. P20a]PIC85455.1 hypothetical protein CSV72_13665 [Sporosarcina sp. P20a]
MNNNFSVKELVWDTEYFGVNSARVILNGVLSKENQSTVINEMKRYDFITIENLNNLNENNIWLGKMDNIFLADMNVQFEKEIQKEENSSDIESYIYNSFPENKEVKNIAQNEFIHSRFINDPYLSTCKKNNVYLHWINSAFNKKNKYFIITKRENEIAGFILFSKNDDKTIIVELIAVDKRFANKRVGKSLMSKLEEFSFQNKFTKIQVGTQINNIVANNFYSKLNYRFKGCSSIYHLWNSMNY